MNAIQIFNPVGVFVPEGRDFLRRTALALLVYNLYFSVFTPMLKRICDLEIQEKKELVERKMPLLLGKRQLCKEVLFETCPTNILRDWNSSPDTSCDRQFQKKLDLLKKRNAFCTSQFLEHSNKPHWAIAASFDLIKKFNRMTGAKS